jgi:hypothetical protein
VALKRLRLIQRRKALGYMQEALAGQVGTPEVGDFRDQLRDYVRKAAPARLGDLQ